MNLRNPIPYPWCAMRIGFDFMPFGFWLRPEFVHRRYLTEAARASGETIWWARWLWFQISYRRWL